MIKKVERKTTEERNKIRQSYCFKRNAKESEIIENYRLIYPNSKVEEYENYMKTAKLVWEEFTGNAKLDIKSIEKKEQQSTAIVVQPIKHLNVRERSDSKEILSSRRNRPVSAIPNIPKVRLTK